MDFFLWVLLFTSLAFYIYGLNCLSTNRMVLEFRRFGLAKFRVLTGVLQLLGASALFAGLFIPTIGLIGASGLTILMLLGFVVRIKIRDGIIASSPALIFGIVNIYLTIQFLDIISSAN